MEKLQVQNDLSKVAEIKISYLPKFNASERPRVTSSKEGFDIMFQYWNKDTIAFQEEFKILLLNHYGRVLGYYHIGTGGMAGVVVDAKLIFRAALKACASSILLFHNHPSGNRKPSPEDLRITERLVEVGKLLDLRVLDHQIITPDHDYFSFADEGLI